MSAELKQKRWRLVRMVVLLQLKLGLSALRDLVLIPVALIAALFDFVRLREFEPRFFRHVLHLGERSDRYIDVWYHEHDDPNATPRENVDALLARVETVVRDREQGARQARVLKRWAERQMQRARERAEKEVSARVKALSDKRSEK